MFTKTALFVFCFIGIFAVLFAGIDIGFYANQAAYSASVGATKEARDRLDTANVTIYGQVGSGNMTYTWSSYWDHPDGKEHQAGLPTGQYLEVWWSIDPYVGKSLQFRHTTENWWGLSFVPMGIFYENGSLTPFNDFLYAPILENAWSEEANASVFYTKNPVTAGYLIDYNRTKYASITAAWDGGELNYVLSYELDQNATMMSVWGLLGAILTFNAPALGMAGIGGLVLTAMVSLPFYVMTGILITKIIFAIIPFIRGIEE